MESEPVCGRAGGMLPLPLPPALSKGALRSRLMTPGPACAPIPPPLPLLLLTPPPPPLLGAEESFGERDETAEGGMCGDLLLSSLDREPGRGLVTAAPLMGAGRAETAREVGARAATEAGGTNIGAGRSMPGCDSADRFWNCVGMSWWRKSCTRRVTSAASIIASPSASTGCVVGAAAAEAEGAEEAPEASASTLDVRAVFTTPGGCAGAGEKGAAGESGWLSRMTNPSRVDAGEVFTPAPEMYFAADWAGAGCLSPFAAKAAAAAAAAAREAGCGDGDGVVA